MKGHRACLRCGLIKCFSQFLEDVGHVFGASLPKSLRRHATLVLALTRVAWHHVAYSAPNVYSLLSVELRAGKG